MDTKSDFLDHVLLLLLLLVWSFQVWLLLLLLLFQMNGSLPGDAR